MIARPSAACQPWRDMEVGVMNRLRVAPAFALVVSCVLSSVLFGAAPGFGQDYPTRYVRIITAGAGTFHDIVARNLAQRLGERWGQAVVVENQPAAGLTIGTDIAAKV